MTSDIHWRYQSKNAYGADWNVFDRDECRKKAEMLAYRGTIEDTFYGYLYRFDIGLGERVQLFAFLIKKPTPCGHTIYLFSGATQFVSKQHTRKFACETIQQAAESFIARKEKQNRLYQAKIDRNNNAIALL